MAVPENLTREQYVYMAKLAEQAERYEEMVKFMDKLVVGSTSAGSELTVEERNLLSVAYKNVIGSLRAAWRIVSSIEQKEEGRKNEEHVALVRTTDRGSNPSSRSVLFEDEGDYHRYLAEFKVGGERKEAAEDTMLAYKAAQELLEKRVDKAEGGFDVSKPKKKGSCDERK
ncbi:unnamed protein product [Thlaspi arvense]|uniref:14-3-3 domain-containing protein n=1 Tax=Thlaspi arvense TaxID=13288 RepID=A0AAU9SDA6_THLAR|nr:unnamed protein product [Thlaspi arvense]